MTKLDSSLQFLANAGKLAKIKPEVITALEKPERILNQKFTVDIDGKPKEFQGYRVQWNSWLGPYKGGIRYHADADLDEVSTLAFLMTIKNAAAGLPLGGGKGAVEVDPHEYDEKGLEAITRGYTRTIAEYIGPQKDVPAPDVNTNGQIMAWVADEYAKITGHPEPAVVTGKPLGQGGSAGREAATGRGGAVIMDLISSDICKIDPKETSVAIQGFGNVGSYLARFLAEQGFNLKAVAESQGGVRHESGLDVEKLIEAKTNKEPLRHTCYCVGEKCSLKSCELVDSQKIIEEPVDILVLAALENQITKENAGKVKAKVILEMANGGIDCEAEKILLERGITVVPDVLANSGGVIVSYFEWQQNLADEHWSEEKVNEKLSGMMTTAFREVEKTVNEYKTDWRTASYIVALKRLEKAAK